MYFPVEFRPVFDLSALIIIVVNAVFVEMEIWKRI